MFVSRPRLVPAPLRNHSVRLLFAGRTASALGSSFTTVALAFAVLQATGSVVDVGMALAAIRLPLALFALAGGVVGDRLSRRAVMLTADVVRFAVQAVAAVLLLTDAVRMWELLALFALQGAAQAFFNPAADGLLPQIVDPADLRPANAVLNAGRSAAAVAGQLLGGVLVAAAGAGAAFAIDSASFLVSACALALLAVPPGRVPPPAPVLRQLREGWSEVRSRTWLWVGIAHIACLNAFALVGFFALGPVVCQRSLGGAAAWGLIGAGFATGMLAGSGVALRLRPARPLLWAFGVVALAAPQLGLLAVAAPVWWVAGAAILGGGQVAVWSALWTSTIQAEVPVHAQSRVSAYATVAQLGLVPAGYVAIGYVGAAVGTEAVLTAGAIWICASTAVVVCLPCMRAIASPEDSPPRRLFSRRRCALWPKAARVR